MPPSPQRAGTGNCSGCFFSRRIWRKVSLAKQRAVPRLATGNSGGRVTPCAPVLAGQPLSGMVNAVSVVVMKQDTLAFLAWIWAHNPVIIVLLAGIPVLFLLVVIDTHRCRKKE